MSPTRHTRTLLQAGRKRLRSARPNHEMAYPDAGSQLAFARVATALAFVGSAAMVVGALAIRVLAIRSLRMDEGEIRRLRIEELEVARIRVGEVIQGSAGV